MSHVGLFFLYKNASTPSVKLTMYTFPPNLRSLNISKHQLNIFRMKHDIRTILQHWASHSLNDNFRSTGGLKSIIFARGGTMQ